jgi:phospholipid/cholesterol/gamma-HCH transport system permease protein
MFYTVEVVGYQALPIIALLSFLIGVVLTYQMGLQLKTYGANIYIVNLTSLAILREFGPLITSIIVAGRTSSAFAAQLGMMKINEEFDAIQTMGLSTINRLVLPKLIGTVIAVPLLTIWANVFGVIGAMIMSKNMLSISYFDFLNRLQEVTELSTFWMGMSKAPVFALIIATVGCFQGFQVAGTAASVGQRTMISVVQAIFLIIIVDAMFSVLFSWRDL